MTGGAPIAGSSFVGRARRIQGEENEDRHDLEKHSGHKRCGESPWLTSQWVAQMKPT